jgi:hypothetical protein
MSFLRDRDTGDIAEKWVASLLQECGINSIKKNKKELLFDFVHNYPEFMSEVKHDVMSARTGNIAIEFFNTKKNKLSGIAATTAQLWFHVVPMPKSVWVASVIQLREYIKNNKPLRVVNEGGDNNASMYLYKQDIIFSEVFHRVDNIDSNKRLEILLKLLGR